MLDLAMDRLPSLPEDEYDDVVVLRGLSWAQYDAIDQMRTGSHPRIAYLDGELELMTTSRRHELTKKFLARLLECYCDEREIALNGVGNSTLRKKARRAGLEPDESYVIGAEKWAPDLAIEVVYTSGGIDKLEIYRRLGVGEVWFWINGKIEVYRRYGEGYRKYARSVAVPGIDLSRVAEIIVATELTDQHAAVRAYRRSLARR